MPREKKTKAIETFINGQSATVPEIIENVGGDTWREHIEITGDNEAKDRYLNSKLGVYMTEDEAREKNITARVLAAWRRKGILLWEQIDSKYYYSRDSVYKALKTNIPKITRKSTTNIKDESGIRSELVKWDAKSLDDRVARWMQITPATYNIPLPSLVWEYVIEADDLLHSRALFSNRSTLRNVDGIDNSTSIERAWRYTL